MHRIGLSLGILGAAVAGTVTVLLVLLVSIGLPLEVSRLDHVPGIWNTYVVFVFACAGFSFVFSGTFVTARPRRRLASIVLALIGIGLVLAMSGDDADSIPRDWLFFCILAASILGALLALALLNRLSRRRAA